MSAGAVDDDRDVGELQRDRGVRLVHRHLDRLHPRVGEHVVRDPAGDRLDQVGGRAGDDRGGALRELAVVQGVGEVVGRGGGGEVQPDGDVDDEVLPVAALVLVDTPWWPRTRRPRSAMRSLTARYRGRAGARAAPSCIAAATATASMDDATSCTRTPQAPAAATSAVIAAVADLAAVRRAGAPSSPASSSPRNRLREAPTSTGNPSASSTSSRPQQRPVVRGRLREPQARVEHDPARVDAGQHRGVHPRHQLGPHLADHVVVGRQRRASGRCGRASA